MKNSQPKRGRKAEPISARNSRSGPVQDSISYPTSAGTSPQNSAGSSVPVVRATTANEIRGGRPGAGNGSTGQDKVRNIERYRSKPLAGNSVEASNAGPEAATGSTTRPRRKAS